MAKYRKKPIVIEATQWWKNGDHPDDYRDPRCGMHKEPGGSLGIFTELSGEYAREHAWEGGIVRYFRHPNIAGESLCKHCGIRMHEHGWIDTMEGGHIACPGDWIITGVKGEHYPCKPDIFAETYESADAHT